jgi:hypothetical protein
MIGKTKELDEQKYNQIVKVKLNYKTASAKQRTRGVCNFFSRHRLPGNVTNQSLVHKQKGKFLPCAVVESFFDIFDDIHVVSINYST